MILRRLRLAFFMFWLCGLPAHMSSANCSTADAPPDQTFNCSGTDSDGVVTGGGNDTVNLNGASIDVGAGSIGIEATGNLTVNMGGGTITTTDREGVTVNGGNLVINGGGQITTQNFLDDGIDATGNITNSANIRTKGGAADAIDSDGDVFNTGNLEIDGVGGNGIDALGNVQNTGNIQLDGGLSAGIYAPTGNVSNSGTIALNNTTEWGIIVGGNVTHTGTINSVDPNNTGIWGGTNGQSITVIGGVITGANISIAADNGNDQVNITIDSTLTGTIDGSSGTDTLTFTGTTNDQVGWNQLQALTGCAPTCTGTFTIEGKTFTYSNFESLVNLLSLVLQGQTAAQIEALLAGSSTDLQPSAPTLTCQNEAVKIFRTPEGFVQVYSGFNLFPNGFLVAVFHFSEAQVGDVFRLDDPNYPAWSVEIGANRQILVKDQNGNVVNGECGV